MKKSKGFTWGRISECSHRSLVIGHLSFSIRIPFKALRTNNDQRLMTKLELADMCQTELTANPVLDEVAPGEGIDDASPLADGIAAVDATTADISAPAASNSPDGST